MVLKVCKNYNLLVKLSKYKFEVTRTKFLGHIITPGQVEIDSKKVKSIMEWLEPKNVK
jgi:hypothetical protein